MKFKKTILILVLCMALMFTFGCTSASQKRDEAEHVNLSKVVFSDSMLISDGNERALDEGEILVFANGSLLCQRSAMYYGDSVYIAADSIEGFVSKDTLDKLTENSVTLDGAKYLPFDEVKAAMENGASFFPADSSSSDRMVPDVAHITLNDYASLPSKDEESALAFAKEQLIKAFENQFGDFEPLSEYSAESYNEKDFLRNKITTCEIKGDCGRFFVVSFVWDLYVDKYTDDIFLFYHGIDMSFTEFDPLADGVFAFAG